MVITYVFEDSLYVNITNRCSNACDFCIRTKADGTYADNLWLEREPTQEEILADIVAQNPDNYKSVVFCGYGEPTERLEEMLRICKELKKRYNLPIRLNTNGQSDLIFGYDTSPDYAGAFDIVSISLNSPDPEGYDEICHSIYGRNALPAILRFASNLKNYVPRVMFSVVRETIPDSDIEKCKAIAANIGVELRVRDYIKTK